MRIVFWLCCFVGIQTALTLSSTTTGKWKPQVASLDERKKLRGHQHNEENIGSIGFHHVEFYCGDARTTAHRFALGLGMRITGSTGQHTGNDKCVSYGLESGDVRFLLTAPYSVAMASAGDQIVSQRNGEEIPDDAPNPLPGFSTSFAHKFYAKHGLAIRALGIHVKDAKQAFEASVQRGAVPVLEPVYIPVCSGQKKAGKGPQGCHIAEVELYGDVLLRYVSFADPANVNNTPILPHLSPMEGRLADRTTFGIRRIDHAVGNVPDLFQAHNRIKKFTGFHEFAEFTPEDVGTVESGLNSVVLASDSEHVLLPLNEPTVGK